MDYLGIIALLFYALICFSYFTYQRALWDASLARGQTSCYTVRARTCWSNRACIYRHNWDVVTYQAHRACIYRHNWDVVTYQAPRACIYRHNWDVVTYQAHRACIYRHNWDVVTYQAHRACIYRHNWDVVTYQAHSFCHYIRKDKYNRVSRGRFRRGDKGNYYRLQPQCIGTEHTVWQCEL